MDICYNEVFEHLKKLKIVVLDMTHARPGSDFFQSLTDGHPEIVQVTGQFCFHDFWSRDNPTTTYFDIPRMWLGGTCSKEPDKHVIHLNKQIEEFIAYPKHRQLFDSRFNQKERWDKLGIDKNEHFEVDTQTFREHLIKLMDNKEINSRNFFLAVHGAYALSTGQDVMKTKIIFYHIHAHEKLKQFKDDFPDFKIIVMTRDLRDGYVSYVEHRPEHDYGYYDPLANCKSLLVYSHIFYDLQNYEDVVFINLRDIHQKPKKIMKDFCEDLGIQFIPEILLESSYHGLLWWGDNWSKYRNGFNAQFGKKKKWVGKIHFLHAMIIEFLFREQFDAFDFERKMNEKTYLLFYILAPFLILLPTKYEIRTFYYNLRRTDRPRIKMIISSFYAYILRIWAYLRVYFNKITRKRLVFKQYG